MWHCDQLEKYPHHAIARFVKAQPVSPENPGGTPLVRKVQLTLDTATHPTPGNYYDLEADGSFTPYVPQLPRATQQPSQEHAAEVAASGHPGNLGTDRSQSAAATAAPGSTSATRGPARKPTASA